VAPKSTAVIDVRVPTEADAERIEATIRALRPVTPGTRIEVDGLFGRPAMEHTPANRELWRLACRAGTELGLTLEEATAGGGSDGNFTSRHTATLDGMGAVGAGAHARHEHLLLGPTIERAALLTLLLAAPPLQAATGRES
jgi:glutamate carboxypeptidase